jgi:NADH-quinone oxidoreductase subunit N
MIYLSLELVSVISFVMAGFKINDAKSSEAAMKYVIFGGVASGIMLYGMSWIFGLTQSLYLGEIADVAAISRPSAGKVPGGRVRRRSSACMAGLRLQDQRRAVPHVDAGRLRGRAHAGHRVPLRGPQGRGFAVLVRFFADALGASGSTHRRRVRIGDRDTVARARGLPRDGDDDRRQPLGARPETT